MASLTGAALRKICPDKKMEESISKALGLVWCIRDVANFSESTSSHWGCTENLPAIMLKSDEGEALGLVETTGKGGGSRLMVSALSQKEKRMGKALGLV